MPFSIGVPLTVCACLPDDGCEKDILPAVLIFLTRWASLCGEALVGIGQNIFSWTLLVCDESNVFLVFIIAHYLGTSVE